jgi:hypothetical protein
MTITGTCLASASLHAEASARDSFGETRIAWKPCATKSATMPRCFYVSSSAAR